MKTHNMYMFTCISLIILCLCITPTHLSPTPSSSWSRLVEFTRGLFCSRSSGSGTAKETRITGVNSRKTRATLESEIPDDSTDPWISLSRNLPTHANKTTDFRRMPSLANGHLGTTVYSNILYMNGLYSGTGSSSHRAAIPAIIMTRVNFTRDDLNREIRREYSYDVRGGVFTERIQHPYANIEHRTYVHRKYIRLLVTQISGETKGQALNLRMTYPQITDSEDIQFTPSKPYELGFETIGTTRSAEEGSSRQTITVLFDEQIPYQHISGKFSLTMLMAADKNGAAARKDFAAAKEMVNSQNAQRLYEEHVTAWKELWDRGNLEVDGDLSLQKAVNFAQYNLLSNMPPVYASQTKQLNDVFVGVARCGLARGAEGRDYQGHVFWDSEVYILPALVLTQPLLVREAMRYRSVTAQRAETYASRSGQRGYRFPWESASTGDDVTPDTCIGCRERQLHVTAAVSHLIRLYTSATRDTVYMKNQEYRGCAIAVKIAEFWANLARYNTSTGRYDINDVMGPDDRRQRVNNNAYTNAAASLAIHWARYMACLCEQDFRSSVPDEWISAAFYLHLPYDNVRRMHFQYDGFEEEMRRNGSGNPTPIKQADLVMLGYPLNWNQSRDIWWRDVLNAEPITDPNTPAMTWSWFTIGFHATGEIEKALQYFERSYQNYLSTPFKVWMEYPERNPGSPVGATDFLPGAGAFLQSILHGFVGIRVRPDRLEFHSPTLPPRSTRVRINRMKYMEAVLNVTVLSESVTVTVVSMGGHRLRLLRNGTYNVKEEELITGETLQVERPEFGFFIYPFVEETCEHPRDYIYMPWGYSPFINSSNRHMVSITALLCNLASLWILLFNK